MSHKHVQELRKRFDHDSRLATAAVGTLVTDLYDINEQYTVEKPDAEPLLSAFAARVKEETSFFEKLYSSFSSSGNVQTQSTLEDHYKRISDLCGLRMSVPYYDRVMTAITEVIRPSLKARGYAVYLQGELRDKDYLDHGDKYGYRSYHFFVQIPAVVDIYGNEEACLCEIQVRTELQDIWAQISHNLIYKPGGSRTSVDNSSREALEDMKQISDSLRTLDHFLVKVRDSINGKD